MWNSFGCEVDFASRGIGVDLRELQSCNSLKFDRMGYIFEADVDLEMEEPT